MSKQEKKNTYRKTDGWRLVPVIMMLCLLPLVAANGARRDTIPEPLSATSLQFHPPFDFPMTFAGNFGEIRADHFHGGLDFKTGGAIGKPMRALADGHIERIRVTHGSGYVLHVAYDNGYTTVCRHLSAFASPIAERVEELQYQRESWEVEITPEPDEYPVRAGQIIALSGNTGYSFGPHLHLEVIEQRTGDYVDPLPFFINKVEDRIAPRVHGLMLCPQTGGYVNGSGETCYFRPGGKRKLTAWGDVGAGICAYDYMNGVRNRYGVHTVVLQVDGEEVFRSVVDRFSDEEQLYINSWTQGQYMKSFIDPNNHLRLLHDPRGKRGIVTIDEERPYHFVYTLSDVFGNTSQVQFTVTGKRDSTVACVTPDRRRLFRWDRTNYLQHPGMTFVVPRGLLYSDVRVDDAVSGDTDDVAFTYRLNDKATPLHGYADLCIGVRRHPVADTTKYYLATVSTSGRLRYVGGRYESGWMKARIRRLGTYTVAVDTVPPVLIPLRPARWGRDECIVIKVRDRETGIRSYRGTIDGQYALFGRLNSIDGNLVCRPDPKRVKRGTAHVVEMSVTDGCGNVTTARYNFVW